MNDLIENIIYQNGKVYTLCKVFIDEYSSMIISETESINKDDWFINYKDEIYICIETSGTKIYFKDRLGNMCCQDSSECYKIILNLENSPSIMSRIIGEELKHNNIIKLECQLNENGYIIKQ